MDGKRINRKLVLNGMDCSDCALVIEHRLERLNGVLKVRADFSWQTVQVEYDPGRISQRTIETRIRQLGYDLVPGKLASWYVSNRELLFSLLGGAALLVAWLSSRSGELSPPAALALNLAAYLLAGYDVLRATLGSLRHHHFDIDLLMVPAALGAGLVGGVAEGALLLFLISLGHALQE